FNGNSTHYTFDLGRNLEQSRTEAFGTPNARTITTQWNSTWRQPDSITEPNRTTEFTYYEDGNLHTRKVTDTSGASAGSRIWTYAYDSYGRIQTIDGPRTDVNDITTYTYYTCTTGIECGQIHTVTNAANQTTTYSSYNAQGRPLTIT